MKVEVNPSEQQLYEGVGIAYDMSTYVRFDKYGLYGIKNKSDFVAESPDDIEDNASFGITWKGFFIKNSYTNGYVSITEDDDFKVVKVINGNEVNKIKIGALEKDASGNPTLYGISVKNDNDLEVFKTDDNGNIVANNITIRGSLHATVFEYEEIQAAGGTILVRPSSSIKDAYYIEENNVQKLVVVVEKTAGFNSGDFCKISNNSDFTSGEEAYIINEVGLIESVNSTTKEITFEAAPTDLNPEHLVSGVLITLGNYVAGEDSVENNYGIVLNSGNSSVNFPSQAITLFTTDYNDNDNTTSYDYKTILGTLPGGIDNVSGCYEYIGNKQGLYTNNIYIGDDNQYLAYYTYTSEEGGSPVEKTKLEIRADQLLYMPPGAEAPQNVIDVINSRQEVYDEFGNLVQNYILMDTNGISIYGNHSGHPEYNYITLDADGLQIKDSSDTTIASYGSKIVIGKPGETRIEIEEGVINLYGNGNEPGATVNAQQLIIPKAVIVDELGVGKVVTSSSVSSLWSWKTNNTSKHLTLVYGG